MANLQEAFAEAVKLNRQITQFLKFSTYTNYDDLSGLDGINLPFAQGHLWEVSDGTGRFLQLRQQH